MLLSGQSGEMPQKNEERMAVVAPGVSKLDGLPILIDKGWIGGDAAYFDDHGQIIATIRP